MHLTEDIRIEHTVHIIKEDMDSCLDETYNPTTMVSSIFVTERAVFVAKFVVSEMCL